MHQIKPRPIVDAAHPQERLAFLSLPLVALAITLVVELFNHKAFTDGPASFFSFVTQHPLALLVNLFIVLLTLAPALFFRRRVFWCTMVSILWLIAGGVNGFILLSLIALKFYLRSQDARPGAFLLQFSLVNFGGLILLVALAMLMG